MSKLQNPKIVKEICDRLSGGESTFDICQDKHMPHVRTLYKWMAKDAEIATSIARARVAQQDYIVDDCQRMADTANGDNWQVIRLRIATRQWAAGKLAPKKYGDKIQNEQSGTITVVIDKDDATNL